MIDPTMHEQAALDAASAEAGTYVEALGRTDLATWSPSEWASLIEVTVTTYQDTLRERLQGQRPVWADA